MYTARANAMLTATAKGFKETFAGAGKDVNGFFKNLKKQAGEESGIGNIGKILKGAGAVAGITLIGDQLERASAKAVELRNEFNAGRIGAAGIAEELAKSLPIIGNYYSFGRNLRELFTGEEAFDTKIANAIQQQTDERWKGHKALLESRKVLDDIDTQMTGLAKVGLDKALFEIDSKTKADIRDIREQFKEAGQERVDQLAQARFQLGKMQEGLAKLDDAQKFVSSFMERTFATVKNFGSGDISGILKGFIDKNFQAGTDLVNNGKAKVFADSQKRPNPIQSIAAREFTAANSAGIPSNFTNPLATLVKATNDQTAYLKSIDDSMKKGGKVVSIP